MDKHTTVSICDFGAEADSTLQTEKIQAAIDHVYRSGGGEVVIPAGRFRTGGLRLRSNITLHLLGGAILEGSRDPEDYDIFARDTLDPIPCDDRHAYALERWHHGILHAIDAENITIIGEEGSVIDGGDCFDPIGEEHFRGPHAINMFYCRNLTFRGYTIKDSANWAHCIFHSRNIEARNLTVLGGHDGFHVRGCENVTVEDCILHTGDDCIAGFANINVIIRRCDLNSACSNFRFGGTNVLVEDIKAWGPGIYGHRLTMTDEEKAAMAPTNDTHRHNTLAFFTYFSDLTIPMPAEPGNIVIRNCQVSDCDRFFQYNFSGTDQWQLGTGCRNIRFENIKATGVSMPLAAYADASLPLTLEMKNVDYSLRSGIGPIDPIQAGNFARLSFRDVTFRGVEASALIRAWGDKGILEQENLTVEGDKQILADADISFASAAI